MPSISVQAAHFPTDQAVIYAIRTQVFQIEQGVNAALEFDGKDEQARHWLAYLDDRPVGTVRIRSLELASSDPIAFHNSAVKLERLAVLPESRNQGVGRKIMTVLLEDLRPEKISTITLHAQQSARAFYEKFGFVAEGKLFQEAEIAHIKMHKRVHP
jgi:predicted GNAT family N-acyltransferase